MATVTFTGMNKNHKKPGRPAGRKPTYNASLRLNPSLGAALDSYIASVKPATTQRAVLELAVEEYLAKHGFWPPQSHGSN